MGFAINRERLLFEPYDDFVDDSWFTQPWWHVSPQFSLVNFFVI